MQNEGVYQQLGIHPEGQLLGMDHLEIAKKFLFFLKKEIHLGQGWAII